MAQGRAGLEDRSQVIRGVSDHRGLVTERSGVVLGHPGRHMCPGRSRIVTMPLTVKSGSKKNASR